MRSYLKTRDFSVSGQEFELVYDVEMDMLVTKPQPEDLDKYYQSEDYISHTDAKQSLFDHLYQGVKRFSIRRKLKLAKTHTPHLKSVLDVGAGTGDFLMAAKNSGWKFEGVEPNLGARNKAMEKGLPLKSKLDDVAPGTFDLITLWHVLEHLPDIDGQVQKLDQHLHKDGTLMIAVPNYRSYDAKYYKEFWAAYDVPRHLWHFSKTSIEKLFAPLGYRIVKIKPMVFDAFYVALLSEKYKTGKHNYLKAVCIGLWSNIVAMKSKECSSHIYVLKKGH